MGSASMGPDLWTKLTIVILTHLSRGNSTPRNSHPFLKAVWI